VVAAAAAAAAAAARRRGGRAARVDDVRERHVALRAQLVLEQQQAREAVHLTTCRRGSYEAERAQMPFGGGESLAFALAAVELSTSLSKRALVNAPHYRLFLVIGFRAHHDCSMTRFIHHANLVELARAQRRLVDVGTPQSGHGGGEAALGVLRGGGDASSDQAARGEANRGKERERGSRAS
jgi:hypothetical protein